VSESVTAADMADMAASKNLGRKDNPQRDKDRELQNHAISQLFVANDAKFTTHYLRYDEFIIWVAIKRSKTLEYVTILVDS
jgi:hypothetical protein